MYKMFYLFLFMSLIYSQDSKSNDNIYTLTEFEIESINTFRESDFSTFSDFTVINNLMESNFYSSDSEIHFGMYMLCLANDNLDCANLHLNRAIQIDGKRNYYDLSDSLTVYKEFLKSAQRAVEKENYNIGIEDYEKIIERFPKRAAPYHGLGMVYKELKDRNAAIINLNKAISINPNKDSYREAVFSIAQGISSEADQDARRQDYNSAIPKYLEAISYYPEFTQAYFQLAKSFYSLRDYKQAELYLLECLNLNQQQLQPLMMLASIFEKKRDSESAERYYRKAIKVDSSSYKAHFRLGKLLMKKDLNASRISLQKAADLKNDYYYAHETLGIVNLQLGNKNEAIQNFKNTIDILGEKSSKRYKSLYLIADIYNSKGKYKEARDYALLAVDIKENGGAANFHLGIAYKSLGEKSRAKSAFQRAVKDKDWRASAKYELDLLSK